MEQKIKSILMQVASETLERLAFLFAFPDDERDTDGPGPAVAGQVDFNGFFTGSLVLRVSTSALQELAANMLGLDDDAEISPTEQQDAFKEMLNVICGNALPAIAGSQVEFNIGSPVILSAGDVPAELSESEPIYVARLMLEEGFCDLYFFVEGGLPEFIMENEPTRIQ
jgi:chemotaxis protein CheY-P-specific phosphatase CheC